MEARVIMVRPARKPRLEDEELPIGQENIALIRRPRPANKPRSHKEQEERPNSDDAADR
jgi:hypothetical protein